MTLQSFADPQVQKCPFPFIAKLHAESPVYRDPITNFWVITRYDDISYVSLNPALFSNKTEVVLGGDNVPGAAEVKKLYDDEGGYQRFHTLVTNDPPDHSLYRVIVDKVFAPSFVNALHPYITALADTLIDDFIAAGSVDLLERYCVRLPIYVISDQLGVPREDWLDVKKWSDNGIALINPALSAEERVARSRVHIELQKYLVNVQQKYLAAPDDSSFFSRLAHAEVQGVRLDAAQFANVGEQLLVAGNETTTSGIAHAVTRLIRDPALMARLRAEPEKIGNFVEEILRIHAPSPHLYRTALEDVEIGGVAIKQGEVIMLSYLAGNHDPDKYPDPEAIDIDRKGVRNHLAFGRGIHFCVGNQLGRAEMRIAVERLLARTRNLRFTPGEPEPGYAAIYHVHAIDHLHVSFDPA